MANGQRGAPVGNKNAARSNHWRDAVWQALEKRGRGDAKAALVELAEKLVEAANGGDPWALKELGDRLDGKPAQVLTGAEGGPLQLLHRIERAIIDPNDSNPKGV